MTARDGPIAFAPELALRGVVFSRAIRTFFAIGASAAESIFGVRKRGPATTPCRDRPGHSTPHMLCHRLPSNTQVSDNAIPLKVASVIAIDLPLVEPTSQTTTMVPTANLCESNPSPSRTHQFFGIVVDGGESRLSRDSKRYGQADTLIICAGKLRKCSE